MPSRYERAVREHYVSMRATYGVRHSIKLTAEKFNILPVVVCRVIGMSEQYAQPYSKLTGVNVP